MEGIKNMAEIKLRCWRKSCPNTWIDFKNLIERKEEEGHYDYVCPDCDTVIICSQIKINL